GAAISPNTTNNPANSIKPGDVSKTDHQQIKTSTPAFTDNDDAEGGLNNDGSGSGSHASNGQRNSVKPPVNIQALDNTKQPAQPVVRLPVPDNTGISNATARKTNKQVHSRHANDKNDMVYTGKNEPFVPGEK